VPEPEFLTAYRVVALPAALDEGCWADGAIVLRLAEDEALVLGGGPAPTCEDRHAIVEREAGFVGVWMTRTDLEAWMSRESHWPLPIHALFVQGMVAGLPMKIWIDGDRALAITRASFAADLRARL
jgi:hypothetical protein